MPGAQVGVDLEAAAAEQAVMLVDQLLVVVVMAVRELREQMQLLAVWALAAEVEAAEMAKTVAAAVEVEEATVEAASFIFAYIMSYKGVILWSFAF